MSQQISIPRLLESPGQPEPVPAAMPGDLAAALASLCDAPSDHVVPGTRKPRARMLLRVAEALEAGRQMVNVRGGLRSDAQPLGPGANWQLLYASGSPVLRPGEPRRAGLLRLAQGARLPLDVLPEGSCREWLVLRGSLQVDELMLEPLSYARSAARKQAAQAISEVVVYVREAAMEGQDTSEPGLVQHDQPAHWSDYAPGIRRRLMWNDGQQAAMLYRAERGASVPSHAHRHDEECLMLAGDIFLDDVLLREGEYQLAPAGTRHGEVSTDTGGLLFAHGDLELALDPVDAV